MSDLAHPRSPDWRTLCARPAQEPLSVSRPLTPPLQLSAVYTLQGLEEVDSIYFGESPGFIYARDSHPNAHQLAEKMAALEGGEDALVLASGMGATAAAFLGLVKAGESIALAGNVYGKTHALATTELSRFGVQTVLFDPTRPETLRQAIDAGARMAYAETLSNPLLRLTDIPELAALTRPAEIPLVIDATFTPMLCRPLAWGADLVMHSGTKFLGGHSDLTLGLLVGDRIRIERLRSLVSAFGLNGNPFESWLALRGIATLGARLARACATALELSRRLHLHPAVLAVHYPGLESHPDFVLANELLDQGYGTMVTIDLGGREQANQFIQRLREIPFAPSLGDVSTTLSHPVSTSHRNQSPERLAEQAITPGLVRLSIGLEDVEDLWDDMDQALGSP